MLRFPKILIGLFLFFSLGSTVFILAQEPQGTSTNNSNTSNVDITITGEVDQQLLDQLSTHLKIGSERMNSGESESNAKGPTQYIDMGQFKKTAINIPYTDSQNDRQQLDIIYPSIGNAPHKVIVALHGGGWENGDRKSASLKSIQMATQQGYAVINIGYRLSDEAKWPAQLYDVKAAIRFIRANAKKFRLDPRNIVVWGNSAGGHLASMLAATNGREEMEDLAMGNPKMSSDVQGVVSWYGISDISKLPAASQEMANNLMGYNVREKAEESKTASPIHYVNKNFPPIYLLHGTNDQVVPFEQSVEFAKRINEVTQKKQASIKLYINGTHSDNELKTATNVEECLNFIDKIMYQERKNPYRSKRYKDIKTVSDKPSD